MVSDCGCVRWFQKKSLPGMVLDLKVGVCVSVFIFVDNPWKAFLSPWLTPLMKIIGADFSFFPWSGTIHSSRKICPKRLGYAGFRFNRCNFLVAPCDIVPSRCPVGYKCTDSDVAANNYVSCACKLLV